LIWYVVLKVDAHCHLGKAANDATVRLFSVSVSDFAKYKFNPDELNDNEFFTVGIHPWDLDSNTYCRDLGLVKEYMVHEKCLGIGEFGLDRAKGPDMTLQMRCFEDHLKILNSNKTKIGVLHIVRAYDLLQGYLSNIKMKNPLIIHDFNANPHITKDLIRHENIYYSLGGILHRNNGRFEQVVPLIPKGKIFLETDDSNHTINQCYDKYFKNTLAKHLEKEVAGMYQNFLKLVR
jgi:TatD DNase family protein